MVGKPVSELLFGLPYISSYSSGQGTNGSVLPTMKCIHSDCIHTCGLEKITTRWLCGPSELDLGQGIPFFNLNYISFSL